MGGFAGFIGLSYCMLILIINFILVRYSAYFRKQRFINSDNRIDITGEIMDEIRFAKMQGFEVYKL